MEDKLWVCREISAEKENDVIFGMDSNLHRDFKGGNAGILSQDTAALLILKTGS